MALLKDTQNVCLGNILFNDNILLCLQNNKGSCLIKQDSLGNVEARLTPLQVNLKKALKEVYPLNFWLFLGYFWLKPKLIHFDCHLLKKWLWVRLTKFAVILQGSWLKSCLLKAMCTHTMWWCYTWCHIRPDLFLHILIEEVKHFNSFMPFLLGFGSTFYDINWFL